MKRILGTSVILAFLLMPAFAFDFAPAFDANAALTYPYTSVDKELQKKLSGAADAAGSFMMNTDFLPHLWLVPTITLNYSSTAQPLNIDDDRFLFSQWLDAYLSAGFNYEFSDSWQARARYFYRKDFSQQTKDEVFGKGLYDYSDNGFYLENVNMLDIPDMETEMTIGFKYTEKKFPNYKTLLSSDEVQALQGGVTDPNTYTKEKDNLNYSFYIAQDVKLGESGWFVNLSYTYDYMPYNEQKVIDSDGSLTSERRIDRFSTINIAVPYYAQDNSGFEIAYDLTIKTTNQNYYDQLGTTDALDDKFINNYYNYYEHTLGFRINYDFPGLIISNNSTKFGLSFDVNLVTYSTRFAKDSEGLYKTVLQKDNNYTLSMDFRQDITEWWNVYLSPSFTKYASNMDWEAFGIYNYTYLTISLGTGITF